MKIFIVQYQNYPCVRTRKVARSFLSRGHDVVYLGNKRANEYIIEKGLENLRILHCGHPVKRGSILKVFFLISFWLQVFKIIVGGRADLIYGVDLDGILPCIIANFVKRKKAVSVFDILDTYGYRYALPRFFQNLLLKLELFLANRSDYVVHVDDIRVPTCPTRSKKFIVRNIPEDRPFLNFREGRDDEPVRILVSGSLEVRRGVLQILAAIQGIPDIEVIFIGSGPGWLVEKIGITSNAVLKGQVSSAEALSIAYQCDAILVYYSPEVLINILACPNKVYDAMACGTAIICNSELKISKIYTSMGIAFAVDYSDIENLKSLMKWLSLNRKELEATRYKAWKAFEEIGGWEREFLPVLVELENAIDGALSG